MSYVAENGPTNLRARQAEGIAAGRRPARSIRCPVADANSPPSPTAVTSQNANFHRKSRARLSPAPA